MRAHRCNRLPSVGKVFRIAAHRPRKTAPLHPESSRDMVVVASICAAGSTLLYLASGQDFPRRRAAFRGTSVAASLLTTRAVLRVSRAGDARGGTKWPKKIADSRRWTVPSSARSQARAEKPLTRRARRTSGRVKKRGMPDERAELRVTAGVASRWVEVLTARTSSRIPNPVGCPAIAEASS